MALQPVTRFMNAYNDAVDTAENPEAAQPQDSLPKPDLQPGEKVFTVALFLVGVFFLIQSLMLWGRVEAPKISSAAALPLFCSGLWTILTFVIMIENLKKTIALSSLKGDAMAALKKGLAYAFPRPALVMLLAIVAYCVSLLLNASFYIVTPLFLWGSMCYLMRKDYVKNILWTALCMAFIFLVFRMLFGVILP